MMREPRTPNELKAWLEFRASRYAPLTTDKKRGAVRALLQNTGDDWRTVLDWITGFRSTKTVQERRPDMINALFEWLTSDIRDEDNQIYVWEVSDTVRQEAQAVLTLALKEEGQQEMF